MDPRNNRQDLTSLRMRSYRCCRCHGNVYYTCWFGAMAFFNLTHLGSQDPFRTATGHVAHNTRVPAQSYPGEDEESEGREGGRVSRSDPTVEKRESTAESQTLSQVKIQSQGKREVSQTAPEGESLPAPLSHTSYMYSGEGEDTWHSGSHVKYTELLRKHQRNPQGPTDLYQQPLTTSQMFGWWIKDGHPEKEPWAQSERHAHVNSEMTRFVDEMSLTNKEFSLY